MLALDPFRKADVLEPPEGNFCTNESVIWLPTQLQKAGHAALLLPYSECLSTFVGQTDRQFPTRMKEQQKLQLA